MVIKSRLLVSLAIAFITTDTAIAELTCMVPPTEREQVSGRFGKYRAGGASNHGSGNTKPHMHDGLDFSTWGVAKPLFATTAGTVIYSGPRGSAGNSVLIKRDNNDVVGYYHLSSILPSIKVNSQVKPGQQLGLSGRTGGGSSMAIHLHFVYGTAQRDQARAKQFASNANKGTFNPAQLPMIFNNNQAVFGYKTDPAPYFCKTFPIQNDGLHAILGKDTKEQHQILFGNIPPGGVPPTDVASADTAAANIDAAVAGSLGQTSVEFLSNSDGYGALPAPPFGEYVTMSTSEMMATEATRRFSDVEWDNNLTKVSSRALWVDYNRTIGVSNYMTEATYRKKERVEALLALYTSLKLRNSKDRTNMAHERALVDSVGQAIK